MHKVKYALYSVIRDLLNINIIYKSSDLKKRVDVLFSFINYIGIQP